MKMDGYGCGCGMDVAVDGYVCSCALAEETPLCLPATSPFPYPFRESEAGADVGHPGGSGLPVGRGVIFT